MIELISKMSMKSDEVNNGVYLLSTKPSKMRSTVNSDVRKRDMILNFSIAKSLLFL